jgi:hypothetical protein
VILSEPLNQCTNICGRCTKTKAQFMIHFQLGFLRELSQCTEFIVEYAGSENHFSLPSAAALTPSSIITNSSCFVCRNCYDCFTFLLWFCLCLAVATICGVREWKWCGNGAIWGRTINEERRMSNSINYWNRKKHRAKFYYVIKVLFGRSGSFSHMRCCENSKHFSIKTSVHIASSHSELRAIVILTFCDCF